jgi:hypothetical protein
MKIITDTHLHLYPCFDLDRAFSLFLDQLQGEDAQADRVACLAERHDCFYYDRLRAGEDLLADFTVEDASDSSLVLQRKNDNSRLTLLPGRQVIARERIEVLALCTTATFTTEMSAADLIRAIHKKNGIPVLPWSPGKWFGGRGRVIDGLLRSFTPRDLLIGDVSLRPVGWATPLLMRKAGRLGYRVVCGSDPLPFSGEENSFGMYASRIETVDNNMTPDMMLRSLLTTEAANAVSLGRRSTPIALFNRLRKNAEAKKEETAG